MNGEYLMDRDLLSQIEKNFKTQVDENFIEEMTKNVDLLKKHIIPDSYPEDISNNIAFIFSFYDKMISRENIIQLSAFPLISKDWLKILAEYIGNEKCLEIMAGSGMLSYGLREFGVDIIPTDNYSWKQANPWMDIEKMDCIDAIKKYGKERKYIIMSWPEMNDNAYKALITMRKVNPNAKMIYIGEFGECCADENFVNEAKIVDNEFAKRINNKFLSWCGIHDLLLILQ